MNVFRVLFSEYVNLEHIRQLFINWLINNFKTSQIT